jgi:hypothetical protein
MPLRAVPTAATGPYYARVRESHRAKPSRVETRPRPGACHPALPHGARARLGPPRVAETPRRSLCGGRARAGLHRKAPPMSTRSQRHRGRSSQSDARPFAGMRPGNRYAAGGDIGAQERMAGGPDGDAPQRGRAWGTSTADLAAVADWCVARGRQPAARASTGGYGRPRWETWAARGRQGCRIRAQALTPGPGRTRDVGWTVRGGRPGPARAGAKRPGVPRQTAWRGAPSYARVPN